jgi:predicted AAA+ superfamily ATPase
MKTLKSAKMEGKMINRPEYLENLKRHKDKLNLIKVVTGVRRCGKSTLFELFQDYLRETGVEDKQILSFNLENKENIAFRDGDVLYEHIKNLTKGEQTFYVFLDELQLASDYEEVVNSLQMIKNIDLYIASSNSNIFSGKFVISENEKSTRLGGRYIDIQMLPLSFKEYFEAFSNKGLSKDELFQNYLEQSSFPESLAYIQNGVYDKQGVQDYLDSVYNSIIVKDIMKQPRIKEISLLERIIKFMFSNIGNETSLNGVVNYLNNDLKLKSDEKKVYSATIASYVEALLNSFLFYEATRFYVKGKEYIKTNAKYYAVDIGLRYFLLGGGHNHDLGQMLENIVYLELLRRGYKVKVGKLDDKEIDFVAAKPDGQIEYYQVSQTVIDPITYKREFRPLKQLQDNYPKFVLTRDWADKNDEGIRQVNVLDWLLS